MRPLTFLLILIILVVSFSLIPFGISSYWVRFLSDIFMMAILASSWNVIGGYTGYPSFGNVVFFGIGAYTTGVLMSKFSIPFFPSLLIAALFAVIFAVLIGLPVLRLKGHYFAIATLGVAEAMREVVANLNITEGNMGLTLPIYLNPNFFYYVMFGILVLTLLLIYWVTRQRLGYGMVAIREDEEAAAVAGVNTTQYKVIAFALSGIFTAMAGGVHAYRMTYIEPGPVFNVTITVEMIVMSIFGGVGTLLGPTVGAFILEGLAELFSTYFLIIHALFFGAIVILVVIFTPRGLLDILSGRRRFGLGYFLENIRQNRV